ncbi:MAG TPA: sigma-70 family RNA polymerase sigma factor [Chitinophaga sp.]|uniref:RNA polymerase sigma factor n=1 Tax=Chitinophaga sp. TaxID=1869181 RepID=UPI002C32CF65|nr:sigma-70 family RNA polymerase sigma factor [Chitinophaga sp.]HVI47191.1 sigma-70 family RNA polymerase sigma factor [Chitinophaga sp.]
MIPPSAYSGQEQAILAGLQLGGSPRRTYEEQLYRLFYYLIGEGIRKYHLTEEDSSSAYSDTIISVIDNIVHGRFEGRASLKSYTYQIFSNKCVDIRRKTSTNREKVHQTHSLDALVGMLPDNARNVVQQLIDNNKRTLLQQCLREIGEKCKQMLLLFEDGYSDKEIATLLEYNSPDVVKVSRRRCMEKLKEKMLPFNHYYE